VDGFTTGAEHGAACGPHQHLGVTGLLAGGRVV
jgi:hypothetical protein